MVERVKKIIESIESIGVECREEYNNEVCGLNGCLLYTSPSPRDGLLSRMPSSA